MDSRRTEDAHLEVADRLRRSLERGRDWPDALLEAMARWTLAHETHGGRYYDYFIGGEAFDWLVLAERLGEVTNGLVPADEWEDLLFEGRFPDSFDESRFKDLLGVDKYRGHLNFFYGVIVEEALQLATEGQVHKRHLSNGNQYQDDFSDEVYAHIYRAPRSALLQAFWRESGQDVRESMSLTESKEFTYWLFKYRLWVSDKAKIASDTKRGLEQVNDMASGVRAVGDGRAVGPAVMLGAGAGLQDLDARRIFRSPAWKGSPRS